MKITESGRDLVLESHLLNLPFMRLAAQSVPSPRDWHLTTSEKVPSPFFPIARYSNDDKKMSTREIKKKMEMENTERNKKTWFFFWKKNSIQHFGHMIAKEFPKRYGYRK